MITRLFPGAGITPFTVWDLTFDWWMRYVDEAQAVISKQRSSHVRS